MLNVIERNIPSIYPLKLTHPMAAKQITTFLLLGNWEIQHKLQLASDFTISRRSPHSPIQGLQGLHKYR